MMIRNTVINAVSYFYPIGNTPAVCFTQDLVPEQDAAILLLGCGDARSVLFTAFADPGRHLDFTCCDIEPAIIARNILLYALLIDDDKNERSETIWNIYYHMKLDKTSLDLLESQVEKLLEFAETLEKWNASIYASCLRFCDQRTFAKVKNIWSGYSSKRMSTTEKANWNKQLVTALNRAKSTKKRFTGDNTTILTGIRSAAPVGIKAIKDISHMFNHYWETGIISKDSKVLQKSSHCNPMFLSSPNQALTLHYGLDPLLGFHLAPAYVPLTPTSAPRTEPNLSSIDALAFIARSEFKMWSKAFSVRARRSETVVRFCVADALSFGHTLQNSGNANLPCDNWTFQPLILDGGDYTLSQGLAAPTRFNVIDTSNLVDHLGPLNILVASGPLLVPQASSALYCEVLVRHESDLQSRMQALLCGDFETIGLFLGLTCIEKFTNATAVSEVEEVMLNKALNHKSEQGSSQMRTRLCLKKVAALSGLKTPSNHTTTLHTAGVEIDTKDLSRLLHVIYKSMFANEDPATLMATMKLQGLSKTSNPYYNRASFVILLKYAQKHFTSDWSQSLEMMLTIIEADNSFASMATSYLQELYLQLHLSGIHTVDILKKKWSGRLMASDSTSGLMWKEIPSVVCITIQIPRLKFQKLVDMPFGTGTPSLSCTVQSSKDGGHSFSNRFCAIQTGFGKVKIVGEEGDLDCQLSVDEDASSWTGKSPLITSFFVPTWILLQEKFNTVIMCGLQPTPHACMAFRNMLGLELNIFETTLGDKSAVYITRYMPNMGAYPKFVTHTDEIEVTTSEQTVECKHSMSVTLSMDGKRIAKLGCKLNLLSESAKTKLADKSTEVVVKFNSPIRAEVTIGDTIHCTASFPIPVDMSQNKLRIARKSSYVELLSPLWQPTIINTSYFLYPMSIDPEIASKKIGLPINWNMPYVNIDVLPVIDTKVPKMIEWMITHVSLAFSARERKIREAGVAGTLSQDMPQDLRVDLKDGMFSMFMHYTGLQGQRGEVFGLCEKSSGVNIIFIASSLKLDLANHTVLLDAAVVPLTTKCFKDGKMREFLGSLSNFGLCQIQVVADELRLWKTILPAFTERCRTWSHKTSCEYSAKEQVPLTDGLEPAKSPLCSCGIGEFPARYFNHAKLPHVKHVLERYATRVAISPIFCVPYVEDFVPEVQKPEKAAGKPSASTLSNDKVRCNACGADKKKVTDSSGLESDALMMCIRCREARYCSAACQKADWKRHKPQCAPA